jgi:surface antigen
MSVAKTVNGDGMVTVCEMKTGLESIVSSRTISNGSFNTDCKGKTA